MVDASSAVLPTLLCLLSCGTNGGRELRGNRLTRIYLEMEEGSVMNHWTGGQFVRLSDSCITPVTPIPSVNVRLVIVERD